jgi:UDP-N-acetylglucosamine 2-epimerase
MLHQAVAPAERPGERSRPPSEERARRRVWLVFADLLANRVFFQCGIVDGLREAFPGELTAVFVVHEKHIAPWRDRLEGIPVLTSEEVLPVDVGLSERVARRLDIELDKRIGFYPLAIRHSLRHGFHSGRWESGHTYPFLDSDRVGPLPRWGFLDPPLTRWHLSGRRHVPSRLLERMRAECEALVVTNPQAHTSMPFLAAARRLDLPVVGYIASWDHPVGKGVVSPHLDSYIVQNETMRDDLSRFHGIDPSRVTVTGWPQTDVYHRQRTRDAYEQLLREHGLPTDQPVVLFAGNTPHNAPYEGNLVSRLVAWWRETGANERFSLLFRPHPYDREVRERFAAALDDPDAAVQRTTFTGLEDLAVLLQHADCLIANAGTILLEALVNDRPSVCVTFDEGAPAGREWAGLNLTGEHYHRLLESEAFYRAGDFEELVSRLERALWNPTELADERRRVANDVVGEVDGRASARVVSAIRNALASRVRA